MEFVKNIYIDKLVNYQQTPYVKMYILCGQNLF